MPNSLAAAMSIETFRMVTDAINLSLGNCSGMARGKGDARAPRTQNEWLQPPDDHRRIRKVIVCMPRTNWNRKQFALIPGMVFEFRNTVFGRFYFTNHSLRPRVRSWGILISRWEGLCVWED
jgi:hypothetical protein